MGVLDKFLDAIKLNDDDDDYLDDDDLMDEDDDFLDDEEELETKPRKKFFEKFSRKSTDDDFDDDLDDLDDLEEETEPVKKPAKAPRSVKPARAARASAAADPAPAPARTISTRPASAPKERAERAPRQSSSKITPMRSSKRSSGGNYEVCVIKPTSMENTREIADTLIDNSTVILNLEGIDVELAQRIIDFTSGACYSLGGTLQKISSYIFVLGPYNVDITGDLQSILGGDVPSVRAGY